LFRVMAGTACGRPARMAAWRAGFWPEPAVSTWPRMTSSTCAASRPVCSSRRLMTMAPSSGAGISARLPWKLPVAVRVAATMTTSCMGLILLAWQSKSFADESAPTGTNKKHPGDTPYVVACSGAVDNLELHLRHMLGHDQPAGGLGDDFLDAHT